MNENIKVAIKVEYECDGIKKVCYGEIEENKLEKLKQLMNFGVGEDNFVWMENDGKDIWKDKESIISIETLGVKSSVFERPRVNDPTKNIAETGICS